MQERFGMARRKVQLQWISSASSRKAAFKKRRECLMRKLMELSTLTGEDACGIVFAPDEGDPPVIWPPSINPILERFFNLPEADRNRKMTTLDSFMQKKVVKVQEQLEKERRKARDEEINYLMNSIHLHGKAISSLTIGETHELFWFLEEFKKNCELRILHLNQANKPDLVRLPPQPPVTTVSSMFTGDFSGQPQQHRLPGI